MAGRTFTYETTVRESQLDSFGHLNHARYLEIFEDARWDLITANGYGLDKVRDTRQGPTILQVQVRYRRELLARQKIRVVTQCLAYERKVARIAQRILDEQGEECCSAEILIGLLDLQARKLIPPTEDWKRAIGL